MTKRIILEGILPSTALSAPLPAGVRPHPFVVSCWRATSIRYGVSAYGRSPQEAKQRLFRTTRVEILNRYRAEETKLCRVESLL